MQGNDGTDDWYYSVAVKGSTVSTDTPDTSIDYKIIEGADGTHIINEDGSYTIRANGDFDKFVNVEIDGKVVDSGNYTAKSGSTIITFKAEYMNSLYVGKHTVRVNFTDGSADTTQNITGCFATSQDNCSGRFF
ncbi:MAG: hypothetical protein MSA26_01550 [Lachnospiraceae bacterium]|nr:hypothetical protein [Lachnospiraceae bacterium]